MPVQKPNIVVIMADDVGSWNIGAYHRGMMAGRTPNLDKLAAEGMLFTDYYAEASCTADGGVRHWPTPDPHWSDHRWSGWCGVGMPDSAPTIATFSGSGLRNRSVREEPSGDLNKYLPTVHGFDEYFGWLYHLNAFGGPGAPRLPAGVIGRSARATWCIPGHQIRMT